MRWEVRNDGGSSQPGDIEKHLKTWEGKALRTGSVRGAAEVKTFKTALGLNQATSKASQPGPSAAADGSGGGGTDAQVVELIRMISAMGAQIEQRKQRNGILEGPMQTSNSKLVSVVNSLKQFPSFIPNSPGPHDAQKKK